MSRTYKDSSKGGRQPKRISVRAIRRKSPDLPALRRAIVAQAMLQASAEAAAEADNMATAQTDGPTPEVEDD